MPSLHTSSSAQTKPDAYAETAAIALEDTDTAVLELPALEAIYARSRGAETRLVGLYWEPTFQALVTGPRSRIRRVGQLRDRTIALPQRGMNCGRATSLRGAIAALGAHGVHHRDVRWIDLPQIGTGYQSELQLLCDGVADAAYVEGVAGLVAVIHGKLRILANIQSHKDRWVQLNGGAIVALTAQKADLQQRFDDVAKCLGQRLQARAASPPSVDFAQHSLIALEKAQEFLHRWGFIDTGFWVDSWIDREPLAAALRHIGGNGR
jgi:ABC-type nitrate/sulfonate/bicarbonate transport system substrate-binding protein